MHEPSDTDAADSWLVKMEARIQKENRRLLANLVAWAEVLDALGWNVALALPNRGVLLNAGAERWAAGMSRASATSWEAVTERLSAEPPARRLKGSSSVHIWGDETATPMLTPESPLTRREAEVLHWLREGKTGPEIAIILGCGQRTVESHVGRIYAKLGVRRRTELMFHSAGEGR